MPVVLLIGDRDMANVRSATDIQGPPATRPALLHGHLVGLAIVAVLPTVFWTTIVYFATWAYGTPLSQLAIMIIAGVMFAFLVCVWASFAITCRRPSNDTES
jgi:hypothetical protein